MELQEKDFQKAVLTVVEGTKQVLGIIHWKMKHPIIDRIMASEDVKIVEVNLKNRDATPSIIAGEILETIRS